MSTIDKRSFNSTFSGGIDTKSPRLAEKLAGTGVSLEQLKRADLDGDGIIKTRAELNAAFKLVDAFDRNGSAHSFTKAGKAGQVYDAFVSAARPQVTAPSRFGAQIAAAALDRAAKHGESYGKPNYPTSPNPKLTSNRQPGVSKLKWLKNHWKCNQFVGDALHQAGLKTPMHKMADGSYHYVAAEQWPRHTQLFDRITDPSKLQVGDIFVRDYPGTGDATAHIEIVTSVNPVKTTGSHEDSAYEMTGSWVEGGTLDAANRRFNVGANHVYILRAKANAGR